MNILNGTEAFEAMMAGRNIMCRAAGELIAFDDLDQFPATVFAKPGYEFCIKIDELTINGFTFLKPYSLDELDEGQDIFLIGNTGSIVKGQFIPEYEELVLAVKNGSVQRDFENAQKQAKAFQSLLGIENELVVKVVDFHTFMKPTTKPKKAPRKKNVSPVEQVEPTQVSSEKPGYVSTDEIETDPAKIIESFTTQINECVKVESVLSLRYSFSANGYLEREHVQHLFELVEAKLIDLDPEQYTPQAEAEDLSVEALKQLQQDAEDSIEDINEKLEADEKYITLSRELMERASNAQSPAEANALIKYTSEWTEEQRKPLLNAIHNRLKDLSAFTTTETQPPSLMVQIQNAKDLNELECLEVEVFNRHPDIQPRLMDSVKRRRFELKNGAGPVGAPL